MFRLLFVACVLTASSVSAWAEVTRLRVERREVVLNGKAWGAAGAYEKLPARLTNRRLETAVTRLFGNDPRRRSFVKSVAQQQGLLQIYEDFCLRDNSDCLHCPFPEQMRKWT